MIKDNQFIGFKIGNETTIASEIRRVVKEIFTAKEGRG